MTCQKLNCVKTGGIAESSKIRVCIVLYVIFAVFRCWMDVYSVSGIKRNTLSNLWVTRSSND